MKFNDDDGVMEFTVSKAGAPDISFTLDVDATCDALSGRYRRLAKENEGTDADAINLGWQAEVQGYFSGVAGAVLSRATTRGMEKAIFERRDALRKKPEDNAPSTARADSTDSGSAD
jgi:hypothetical protein